MVGTNNKQNANKKRRLIIFASAIIVLAVLASLAGSCASQFAEITAQDITININGEACESLEVYAGGETVAPKTLQSITLQTLPNRMPYTAEGELFSVAGIVVKANKDKEDQKNVFRLSL